MFCAISQNYQHFLKIKIPSWNKLSLRNSKCHKCSVGQTVIDQNNILHVLALLLTKNLPLLWRVPVFWQPCPGKKLIRHTTLLVESETNICLSQVELQDGSARAFLVSRYDTFTTSCSTAEVEFILCLNMHPLIYSHPIDPSPHSPPHTLSHF